MKILVTGGLGYIGSHTVVDLIEAGHEPIIIDDLSNSSLSVHHGLEQICGRSISFYQVDILEREKLDEVLSSVGKLDGVIHFAARKSVPESLGKPLKYYENNITGLLNVLKVCEKYKVPRFVFSSSCTVYGEPEELPITEQAPVKLSASPYGNTKLWAEQMITEYAGLRRDFQAVLLRYFNPVGAHESGLIGELPRGVPSNLMPFITQTAAGWREELKVFGNDYNTHDGTAIRDFIHVTDLAAAHVKALQRLNVAANQNTTEAFNIGTGKGHSVLEMIHSFEEQSGQKVSWSFAPRRAGDIEQIWADSSKAREELQWEARCSLDDMTASAWKWQQSLKKPREY